MKIFKSIIVILFLFVIFIPIIFFNFKPQSVSEIDNRMLTENPFSSDSNGDLTKNIENYINDRIGFRDEMILSYTVLNDTLFNKMVHPSYVYGKDGYVFGAGLTTSGLFSDYHITFADMVAELQEYCESRGVPFLFVFNPAKPAVLSEYVPTGLLYSRDWVELFFNELDKRGVNYVDNTETLKYQTNNGVAVFNQKYDANHWNYIGAYYGTNKMLETLKERLPSVHINNLDEFNVSEETKTSLLVSNFPINESVPLVQTDFSFVDNTGVYASEIERHSSYKAFGSYSNESRKEEGAPSALVFQGSYMNGYGYQYLINGFSEYTFVHDYQNVIDMPYYFNIFKPDCVIFEVAEYTFSEIYFSQEQMKNISYNKPLKNFENYQISQQSINSSEMTVQKGETLTKIKWHTDINAESAWLLMDEEYDMKKVQNGYEVTVKTENYQEYLDTLAIVTYCNDVITHHRLPSP